LSDDVLPLTNLEIGKLQGAFHRGAFEASEALSKWLSASTIISIESIDQCRLKEATSILEVEDSAICMCVMGMEGTLTGQMLLAFDDTSGLAMADLVIGHSHGTAKVWGEVETSAALESMNIAGSAYLNGIARDLSARGSTRLTLIPTPPTFLRDYAESLLETAFLNQAAAGSHIVFAKARFEILGNPMRWTFLLIPDPQSLDRLTQILQSVQ